MPVNMDPNKRCLPTKKENTSQEVEGLSTKAQADTFGEETEADREKALAEAEEKHLWEQTEVIDMDQILPGSGNTYPTP